MSEYVSKKAVLEHIRREIGIIERQQDAVMTRHMKEFYGVAIRALQNLEHAIQSGAFDIKPPEVPDLKPGDQVRHKKERAFIRGQVLEISKSRKTARVEWVEYDRNVFPHGSPWPAYYRIDKLEKVEESNHD